MQIKLPHKQKPSRIDKQLEKIHVERETIRQAQVSQSEIINTQQQEIDHLKAQCKSLTGRNSGSLRSLTQMTGNPMLSPAAAMADEAMIVGLGSQHQFSANEVSVEHTARSERASPKAASDSDYQMVTPPSPPAEKEGSVDENLRRDLESLDEMTAGLQFLQQDTLDHKAFMEEMKQNSLERASYLETSSTKIDVLNSQLSWALERMNEMTGSSSFIAPPFPTNVIGTMQKIDNPSHFNDRDIPAPMPVEEASSNVQQKQEEQEPAIDAGEDNMLAELKSEMADLSIRVEELKENKRSHRSEVYHLKRDLNHIKSIQNQDIKNYKYLQEIIFNMQERIKRMEPTKMISVLNILNHLESHLTRLEGKISKQGEKWIKAGEAAEVNMAIKAEMEVDSDQQTDKGDTVKKRKMDEGETSVKAEIIQDDVAEESKWVKLPRTNSEEEMVSEDGKDGMAE
ncbi:uncharacterized protein I303_102063 [Kwoniella dejecticola CBS 10117]|uniref:Uncharacterized protein n=1 Tax=Kwoniella dejecticola CBS 10117 TaxID=1296121 RepID=A0A1A6AC13_9TREE|nr:uncharacterized protein I303_01798 [Kwoniella dejecticola CBS 10117]OBR87590.1 hypothetical protein I303_01798 [Kwoniella dejecticola CBS 10117]